MIRCQANFRWFYAHGVDLYSSYSEEDWIRAQAECLSWRLSYLYVYFFSWPSTAQNSDRTASERLKKVPRVALVFEGRSTVCTVSDGDEE